MEKNKTEKAALVLRWQGLLWRVTIFPDILKPWDSKDHVFNMTGWVLRGGVWQGIRAKGVIQAILVWFWIIEQAADIEQYIASSRMEAPTILVLKQ